MINQRVTGTFDAVETSETIQVTNSHFTVSLSFGTGTVKLQRSFDEGTTWKDVKTYTESVEENGFEPATGVQYRLNCTAHTSDIDYILSTNE